MIVVDRFNLQSDFRKLCDWRNTRGLSSLQKEDLPKEGAVAFYYGMAVAMGFLRKIEGNMAMLDSYITDPEMAADWRNACLDQLTSHLVGVAKKEKITGLIAYSQDTHTIKRAQQHGFVIHKDDIFMTLDTTRD